MKRKHDEDETVTDQERIDEAATESFPASDPPSWNSGLSHGQVWNTMNPDDQYQFHSSYPVWQIEAVSLALEKAGVEYQVSFDDSGIKQMDAVTAMMGGTYGDGAQARLFIKNEQIESANTILEEFLAKGAETEHPEGWFRTHFGIPPSNQA